jgi:hypothetical protein
VHASVALQAVFTVHKQRTAALPAAAQGPAKITLRITNHTPSELHIRQLKSNSIGRVACMLHAVAQLLAIVT